MMEFPVNILSPQLREEHKRRGKFCGKTIPAALTTEANILYVHFVSDQLHSGRGFEAVYGQAEGKNY